MKNISYFYTKLKYKIFGKNKEIISEYFRKKGMTIGRNCNICTNILTSESYLINIGNNVTIAGGVSFVTHDNCVSKMIPDCTDLFGNIVIGDNCFIGANAIILYGVSLTNNITVAAGSVVTKSFNEENIIIGGNPAKKISDYSNFIVKNKDRVFNLDGINHRDLRKVIEKSEKLIQR
ncbi:MAG: acyltransferase [Acholeplasma sp.]|nr:acyltransferase [Acholeplasma sp.]